MTDPTPDALPDEVQPVKSMRLFFIDNQGLWPDGTQLAGDFVIWPDTGVYPTAQPVSLAGHPSFAGKIVVQAGSQSIIVTFCPGAKDVADCRKQLSARGLENRPEQYRVAVDAIIQRIMLWRNDRQSGEIRDDAHPFALMEWMKKAHHEETKVYLKALKLLLANTEAINELRAEGLTDAWDIADSMASALEPKP